MSRLLKFGRKPARTGRAKSLVVFLHGYGADGADLLGLADVLAPHLPATAFVAPDAAERLPGAPFGRQWFPIPEFDGSSLDQARAGLSKSAEDIDAFLDQRLAYEGLGPESLAVIGFSQGAMMALDIAPRRDKPLACVIAISGRLLRPDTLAEARARPPVLLMHGDQDQVVPFSEMSLAADALAAAGFETYVHVMKGSGHGIAQDGLETTLAFLMKYLPAA